MSAGCFASASLRAACFGLKLPTGQEPAVVGHVVRVSGLRDIHLRHVARYASNVTYNSKINNLRYGFMEGVAKQSRDVRRYPGLHRRCAPRNDASITCDMGSWRATCAGSTRRIGHDFGGGLKAALRRDASVRGRPGPLGKTRRRRSAAPCPAATLFISRGNQMKSVQTSLDLQEPRASSLFPSPESRVPSPESRVPSPVKALPPHSHAPAGLRRSHPSAGSATWATRRRWSGSWRSRFRRHPARPLSGGRRDRPGHARG